MFELCNYWHSKAIPTLLRNAQHNYVADLFISIEFWLIQFNYRKVNYSPVRLLYYGPDITVWFISYNFYPSFDFSFFAAKYFKFLVSFYFSFTCYLRCTFAGLLACQARLSPRKSKSMAGRAAENLILSHYFCKYSFSRQLRYRNPRFLIVQE